MTFFLKGKCKEKPKANFPDRENAEENASGLAYMVSAMHFPLHFPVSKVLTVDNAFSDAFCRWENSCMTPVTPAVEMHYKCTFPAYHRGSQPKAMHYDNCAFPRHAV